MLLSHSAFRRQNGSLLGTGAVSAIIGVVRAITAVRTEIHNSFEPPCPQKGRGQEIAALQGGALQRVVASFSPLIRSPCSRCLRHSARDLCAGTSWPVPLLAD